MFYFLRALKHNYLSFSFSEYCDIVIEIANDSFLPRNQLFRCNLSPMDELLKDDVCFCSLASGRSNRRVFIMFFSYFLVACNV